MIFVQYVGGLEEHPKNFLESVKALVTFLKAELPLQIDTCGRSPRDFRLAGFSDEVSEPREEDAGCMKTATEEDLRSRVRESPRHQNEELTTEVE